MDYFFSFLTFALCLPMAYYIVKWTGWEFPEYHKEDAEKMWLSIAAVIISFICTIVIMSHT
jgi:hypothetical protein